MTPLELIDLMKVEIAKELSIEVEGISETESFLSIGMDSIAAIFLLDKLEKHLGLEINPIWFWDYPTIESLSIFLCKQLTDPAE